MQNRSVGERSYDIDRAFTFLAGCLLIGILAGVIAYCFMDNPLSDSLSRANSEYISFRQNNNLGRILADSFFTSSLFIGAMFLSGMFALGQLLSLGVLLIRGIGIGAILSQSYYTYQGDKLIYTVLIIVPAAIISCYGLVLAAKEAVRLSTRLLIVLLSNDSFGGFAETFKAYGVSFLFVEAVISVSAAIDCVFSLLLSDKI
ncbi:MAG: stage II sporulation protein M [Ruminococcus sp.]|nr:stage II sporulation protein M [Ruminococcus sp.]